MRYLCFCCQKSTILQGPNFYPHKLAPIEYETLTPLEASISVDESQGYFVQNHPPLFQDKLKMLLVNILATFCYHKLFSEE